MKVFAIATAQVPREQIMQHLPTEVPATLKLYLGGKIEQFWFKETGGPIFLMDVASLDDAQATLDTLPLVAQKLMTYELIPVGPLAPLEVLLQGR